MKIFRLSTVGFWWRLALTGGFSASLLIWGLAAAKAASSHILTCGQAEESTTQFSCVWDGLHNVAPCLQREIDQAAREGCSVTFPPGRWPLGQALVLASNINIDGSHRVTLVPMMNNNDNPLLLRGLDVINVHIVGITFDGGGAAVERVEPVIKIDHGSEISFDEIAVTHTSSIGIVMEANTNNSGVKNSRFADVGNRWKTTRTRRDRSQALVFCCGSSNSGNYAIGNHFEDIGLDALQLSDQRAFRALDNIFFLENSQRQLLPSPDYPAAIFAPNSSHVTISRNTIRDAQGNCIDAPGLQKSVVSDNDIRGCGGAGIGIFLGYDGVTQPRDLLVTSNTIRETAQWAWSAARSIIFIWHGAPLRTIVLRGNHT
jgi:Right handed beta helix region